MGKYLQDAAAWGQEYLMYEPSAVWRYDNVCTGEVLGLLPDSAFPLEIIHFACLLGANPLQPV